MLESCRMIWTTARLTFLMLAIAQAEEQHGGCDLVTQHGVLPDPLFGHGDSLESWKFGAAGPAPTPSGATPRGCARMMTCGECAAVVGCGWCANAWSQSCVDAEDPAASCACASSVISSPSACSDKTATMHQVERVDGIDGRPTCDANRAGTVVADTTDGAFYGCSGETAQWLALGGAGSAILSPPIAAPVDAAVLPFSDDLSSALTLLVPAPLSVFQSATDVVDVELSAAGCIITVDAVARVVQLASNQSSVHIQGLMGDINVAMQKVRMGCYCIGSSGAAAISVTVTSVGVATSTSIPVAVGTPAHVTTVSGAVVDHTTDQSIEGVQVRLSYAGRSGLADVCTVDTATTDAMGSFSIDCPSEYLGGGHHVRLYASEPSAGEYSIRAAFAATVGGTVLGPKISLVPSSSSVGEISGLCLSAADLEPVGGASVSLHPVNSGGTDAPAQTQLSNAQGEFGFDQVEQGAYRLIVQRPFAVTFEDVVVVTAGATESLLAPLAQERAGAAHWRAVLLWRGSAELDARVEATGCPGGNAVAVTSETPSGCGTEHAILYEASYSVDAGFGGAASLVVQNTTSSGTYMFSVSSTLWSGVQGATVRVYSSSTVLSEVVLPHVHPSGAAVWNVFCWDSATSTIHIVGSVGSQASCAQGCVCG